MKTKSRPIIEWLNELPELIRELVIADFIDIYVTSDSMSEAIYYTCMWMKTKIGFDFYFALYLDALYHEQNNLKLPR